MVKSYITKNPSQTRKLGEKLAKEILAGKPRSKEILLRGRSKKTAFIMGLEGELGGGKTTFLQGFARGLGIKQRVLSPTFVVMKKFRVPSSSVQGFYHIDCYRIQKTEEISFLELRKIISMPENIVAIEWADRIRRVLPINSMMVKFNFIDKKTRKIIVKYP